MDTHGNRRSRYVVNLPHSMQYVLLCIGSRTMPKSANLVKLLKRVIKDQPLVIHRWVLKSGDGVNTSNAWSYYYSWVGRIDTIGRGTWQTMMSPTGQSSASVLVVTIPYEVGQDAPVPEDKIVLFYPTGVSAGTYRVVSKTDFTDEDGVMWKHELTVEIMQ